MLSYVLTTATLNWDTRTAADDNAEALRLIGSAAKAKRPFFLFVSYMEAHTPYVPGPGFWDRYKGRDRHFTEFDKENLRKDVRARKRLPTLHERDHLISQYDACIARLDTSIGRFIQQLKDLARANALHIHFRQRSD